MLLTNILKKMKRLVLLLTVVLLLSVSQNLQAQDVYSPWTASLSTNAINNPVLKAPNNLGRFKTWNWEAAGFKGAISRHLTGNLSLEGSVTLTGIKQNYIDVDKKFSLIALDGLAKYNVINNFNVNPYVAIGGGLTWVDTLGKSLTANAGVGLNVWLTYNFGLTGQSIYKHALDDYGISHFQHSVGIIFKFGGTDNDNDGIINKEDNCPNVFGLAMFNGCPDTDKDGIMDQEDNCPDIAGTLNGCPDADNDGVADPYDKCPNFAGDKTNNGCPLPDTDNDGVPDKFDKCPSVKGLNNNNGCPPEADINQTNITSKPKAVLIYFELSKSEITAESKKILDNVASYITKSNIKTYEISGHTDNTSSAETNLKLSLARANAVRDYLVAKGIDKTKLITRGFGEEFPVDSSNTEVGRHKNRRVEIIPMI